MSTSNRATASTAEQVPTTRKVAHRNTASMPTANHTPVASGQAGITVLSKFTVANGKEQAVKTAFQNRPHLVENAAGFFRMEVLSPLDRPAEIWLLTFWEDRDSYQRWHRSHLYQESHHGMPPGLKLVPGETSLTEFEHVTS